MWPGPGKKAWYDQYRADVLPPLLAAWSTRCFCDSSQFCKILSYDFRDYGHDTSVLLDAEILCHDIIYKRFTPVPDAEAPETSR